MFNRKEKKVRHEICKHILNNPSSINFIKKGYLHSGELNQALLMSFKEKVLLELRTNNEFHAIKDEQIEKLIEDELKKYILRNSKPITPLLLNFKKVQAFIRRFPSVTLFLMVMISLQIASYFLSNELTAREVAIKLGALETAGLAPEQMLRMATNLFFHTEGFIISLIILLILAPPLERIYGSIKFPLLFFMTGIVGTYFLLHATEPSIVGGPIISYFGLIGAYFYLYMRKNHRMGLKNNKLIWPTIIGIVGYTLYAPSLPMLTYIGGLGSGFLFALIIKTQAFVSLAKTNWKVASLQTTVVSGIILLLLYLPSHSPEVTEKVIQSIHDGVSRMTEAVENREQTIFTPTSLKPVGAQQKTTDTSTKVDDGEIFDKAIQYMKDQNYELAIHTLQQIPSHSSRFEDAQQYIKTIETITSTEQVITDYQALQKNPQQYNGHSVHFYGRIYNIQEMNGKTIFTLSTNYDSYYKEYIGDEILVLHPSPTSLNIGDYVHIYGEMLGNYRANYSRIQEFTQEENFVIYFDQRTFFEQAPVIFTKVIVE